MESLYTKYRPQTFADVVGQAHVVKTLERAVLEGRTSHAYLFCGPRGTGKTTMARLLAKALMCEKGEGHLPDGTCEQCRLIATGEHPDVYELDAASRTGVDNVRDEIISRVNFAPVRGRYKLYIIDEVHMLTTAAFNALLKTLEEPPAHVVFVLCTTDPQKIPETILSRVQRFDFHAIGNADIQARLAYICEREGFSYDPEALELVVRHARGGMRDAISELEQLSVSGGGTIGVDVARDVLGEVAASTLEKMSLAMANRDVPTLFAQVESMVEVGRDLLQLTRALAARLRDVYVVAAVGQKSAAVMAADADLPAISREAQAFGSVDRVARAMQLLSDASTEMRVAPNQRLVLEVALTKIARPQAELTLEALADRVASLERQVAALAVPRPQVREQPQASVARQEGGSRGQAPATQPAPAPQAPGQGAEPSAPASPAPVRQAQAPHEEAAPAPASGPQPAPAAVPASRSAAPAAQVPPARPQAAQPARPAANPDGQAAHQAPAPAPAPAPTPAPTQRPDAGTSPITDQGELQRRWKQVVGDLLAAYPQHGSLLIHATVASDDGQRLLVSFPKGSSFACKMLDRPDVRAHVDPAIARVFGPRKTHFAESDVVADLQARGAVPAPAASPQQAAPAQQAEAPAPAPVQTQSQAAASAPWQRQQAPVGSAAQPGARPQQSAQAPVQPPAQAPVQTPVQAPVQTPPPRQQQPQRHARVPQQPQPMRQVQPADRHAQQPSPAPVYPAPWDALPDDDQVPYDDLDAAPYEEDYLFGTVDAPTPMRQAASVSPAGSPAPATSFAGQAPSVGAAQTFVPDAPAAASGAGAVPPAPATAQIAQPAPATAQVAPPAPAQEPAPQAPAPTAAQAPREEPAPQPPAPVPTEPPAPATAEPPAQEPPKKPRAKRRSGGSIDDLIAMMNEIFGEGVTYTELAPDEDEAAEDSEDGQAEDAALADEGYDAEGEYAVEPVDDADYEDED